MGVEVGGLRSPHFPDDNSPEQKKKRTSKEQQTDNLAKQQLTQTTGSYKPTAVRSGGPAVKILSSSSKIPAMPTPISHSPSEVTDNTAINFRRLVNKRAPFGVNAAMLSSQERARLIATTINQENLQLTNEQLDKLLEPFASTPEEHSQLKQKVENLLDNPEQLSAHLIQNMGGAPNWKETAKGLLERADESIVKERNGQVISPDERKHLVGSYLAHLFAESALLHPDIEFDSYIPNLFKAVTDVLHERFEGQAKELNPGEKELFLNQVKLRSHDLTTDPGRHDTLLAETLINFARSQPPQHDEALSPQEFYHHLLYAFAWNVAVRYPREQEAPAARGFEQRLLNALEKQGCDKEYLKELYPTYVNVERLLIFLKDSSVDNKVAAAIEVLDKTAKSQDQGSVDLLLSRLPEVGVSEEQIKAYRAHQKLGSPANGG